jgi:N-methylhydantoinase A
VTDANLLLGYLPPGSELAGGVGLDEEAAERALARLGSALGLDPLRTAEGIVAVANAEMIRALRVVTVERGIDPRRFALLPFGGAGPMHAAALAQELGARRILCPRAGGVLSALGLCAGERRRDTARTVLLRGAELTAGAVRRAVAELVGAAGDGIPGGRAQASFGMRYRGQAFELEVAGPTEPDPAELAEAFAAAHERRYGYRDEDAEVELVDLRVTVAGPRPGLELRAGGERCTEESARRARFAGAWLETRVIRGEPTAGFETVGPAIFELPESTLVLPPGWAAKVDGAGTVVAER